MDKPDADEVLNRLRKKVNAFHKVFSTPEGKEVLEALEAEFNADVIFHENPYVTNYNLGRRDVVVYINQMLRVETNREET